MQFTILEHKFYEELIIVGSIGKIWKDKYDYFLVELNYRDFGEDLTKDIKIPFELFEKKNKTLVDKFIREQITNFNIPF